MRQYGELMDYYITTRLFNGYAMIAFLFADAILIYYANKHFDSIDNEYFNFHKKYGFLTIEILKLFVAVMIIGGHFYPTGKSGFFLAASLLYYAYVLRLLKDILFALRNERKNLDSSPKSFSSRKTEARTGADQNR